MHFQVVADAKTTLDRLIPLLEGYESEFGSRIGRVERRKWLAERERLGTC